MLTKRWWGAYFATLAALGVFALLVWAYVGFGSITYSEGERTGVVTKFSNNKFPFSTWEGELHMGGITDGGVPSIWPFSVVDKKAIEAVTAAQRKGGRVTLQYRQQLWLQRWKGKTSYFVTNIQSEKESP